MASVLASTLLLGLALPCLTPGTPATPTGEETRIYAVRGPVELSSTEAMRSAEEAVRAAILERFGQSWRAERAFWVPESRVEAALAQRLRRLTLPGGVVRAQPVEAIETTFGTGYRQSYHVALDANNARHIRGTGLRCVRHINEEFAARYGAMGAVWLVLFLLGFGVDRATRGWLTGRIAVAAVGMGSIASWLLLP